MTFLGNHVPGWRQDLFGCLQEIRLFNLPGKLGGGAFLSLKFHGEMASVTLPSYINKEQN